MVPLFSNCKLMCIDASNRQSKYSMRLTWWWGISSAGFYRRGDNTKKVGKQGFNAYFEMNFQISKRASNGNYVEADDAAIINSVYLMIQQLKVDFNGDNVLNSPYVNHAVNVKNLTEFSKSYSDSIGQSMLYYVDTTSLASSQKYTTMNLNGNAQNIAPTDNVNYNEGFTRGKSLLFRKNNNDIILPLNRYSFFDAFQEEISPNGKVTFDVTLEHDNEVIFRSNATVVGRYIITKFVLWVPKMILNSSGENLFLAKYISPHLWTYLKKGLKLRQFHKVDKQHLK